MAIRRVREEKQYTTDGSDVRRVLLAADTEAVTAETIPTTGEGVDFLPDSVKIGLDSVLLDYTTSKKYVYGSDGWHEWGGSNA